MLLYLFHLITQVPWCQLAETLNMKFKSACERELTADNLRFLAGKLFRQPGHGEAAGYNQDYSHVPISWSKVTKHVKTAIFIYLFISFSKNA